MLNIVPAQARTLSCVRHTRAPSPLFVHRVDFAAHRLAYARQDAALGAVLKREVRQLIQALIPASVRANPKAIREVQVPDAWKARVRGEVGAVLRQTWAAGQASARSELRMAAPGKFTFNPDEARDASGKWTDGGDAKGTIWVYHSGRLLTGRSGELHANLLEKHTGSRNKEDYWTGTFVRLTGQVEIRPAASSWKPNVTGPQPRRAPPELLTRLSEKFPGARINLIRFDLSPETLPEYIDTLAYNLTESLGSDVVEKLRPIWAQALAQDWSSGMLSDKLLEALSGYVDASGSDLTPARIATIVRTTDTNAYNLARKEVFEDPALNGFVEAYEYSAILDDRTTALCEELDGKVYLVDDPFWDEFTPPNHFNCRSLLIPIVQGDEWTASKPVGEDVRPQTGFHLEPDAA